jgi:hypothetical protein
MNINNICGKFNQFANQTSEYIRQIPLDKSLPHALVVSMAGNLALLALVSKATTLTLKLTERKWIPICLGSTLIAMTNYVFFNKIKTAVSAPLQIAITVASLSTYYLIHRKEVCQSSDDDDDYDDIPGTMRKKPLVNPINNNTVPSKRLSPELFVDPAKV